MHLLCMTRVHAQVKCDEAHHKNETTLRDVAAKAATAVDKVIEECTRSAP
jgi:hypothetical protein